MDDDRVIKSLKRDELTHVVRKCGTKVDERTCKRADIEDMARDILEGEFRGMFLDLAEQIALGYSEHDSLGGFTGVAVEWKTKCKCGYASIYENDACPRCGGEL